MEILTIVLLVIGVVVAYFLAKLILALVKKAVFIAFVALILAVIIGAASTGVSYLNFIRHVDDGDVFMFVDVEKQFFDDADIDRNSITGAFAVELTKNDFANHKTFFFKPGEEGKTMLIDDEGNEREVIFGYKPDLDSRKITLLTGAQVAGGDIGDNKDSRFTMIVTNNAIDESEIPQNSQDFVELIRRKSKDDPHYLAKQIKAGNIIVDPEPLTVKLVKKMPDMVFYTLFLGESPQKVVENEVKKGVEGAIKDNMDEMTENVVQEVSEIDLDKLKEKVKEGLE